MQIIVKKYEHFNTALPNWDTPKGVYVKSKDHYDRLLKENNMVVVEEAGKTSSNMPIRKEYSQSAKAKAIIEAASQTKDRQGKVKLGDRAIEAMKSIGALNKKIPDYMKLPSSYEKGRFL